MNHHNVNSDFYEFCFPDISKSTQKDYQSVFSEYGCMEAINLEYDELERKIEFTAKKQKPVLSQDDVKLCQWLFLPRQPVLPLGKPSVVSKLLKQATVKDMWSMRRINNSTETVRMGSMGTELANVGVQIENLIVDHCDVAQGTFLEMFSHYFPFHISHQIDGTQFDMEPGEEACIDCDKVPESFIPKNGFGDTKQFPAGLDPFMFDVPLSLLNELLLEEVAVETERIFYDSSYSGGALCYKHLDSRKSYDYGLLVRAAGSAMDELSLQLLCTDTCKSYDDTNEQEFLPKLHLGSDYRFDLNGRILQIDVQPSREESSHFFVGTRSQHHVLITSVDGKKTILNFDDDDNYTGLTYSSKSCAKHLGVLQSPHVVTSMCTSPYMDGECVLATDDGKLYLWRASQHSKVKVSKKRKGNRGLEVIIDDDLSDTSDKWRQVEFGAHPRQILIADRAKVNLIDLRQHNHSTRGLCVSKSPGNRDEMISSMLSGVNFSHPHEYQCITATSSELMLMDTRHCNMPLLRWSLNMRYPCQHLSCIGASHDSSLSSMIFAANQTGQESHMYQYNLRSKSANPVFETNCFQHKMHPPVSLAPPYSVGTFKDVRRSVMAFPLRCHGYISDRLSYPIIGLTGYEYKNPDNNVGVVALQLSGCGDLLYQSFGLQDPKLAWSEENSISGPVSRHSNAVKMRKKQQQLTAEELYRKWAKKVDKGYLKAARKENPFNLRCTQTTSNNYKFSFKKMLPDLLESFKKKRGKDCVICSGLGDDNKVKNVEESDMDANCRDPVSSILSTCNDFSLPNAQATPLAEEKIETVVCDACKLPTRNTRAMLTNFKAGIFHPGIMKWSDNDAILEDDVSNSDLSYHRAPVKKLKLVEPVVSKTGLGRVLTFTWDQSYEELWEVFREEFLSEKKEKEIQERQNMFDLTPKDVARSPPPTNSIRIRKDKIDLYEISSTTESDAEDQAPDNLKERFSFSARRKIIEKLDLKSAGKCPAYLSVPLAKSRSVDDETDRRPDDSLQDIPCIIDDFGFTPEQPRKRLKLCGGCDTPRKSARVSYDSFAFSSFTSSPRLSENQPMEQLTKNKHNSISEIEQKDVEAKSLAHRLSKTPSKKEKLKKVPTEPIHPTTPTHCPPHGPLPRPARLLHKKPPRRMTGFF